MADNPFDPVFADIKKEEWLKAFRESIEELIRLAGGDPKTLSPHAWRTHFINYAAKWFERSDHGRPPQTEIG